MAKRSKSELAGGIKWDNILSTCAFEEENWSPCVAWVVGRQPEDFKHIEALNVIVQTGTRKLFSVITKEQLLLDVHELGNPKSKKAKEIIPNSEVCEACKVYLDAAEPIPTALMAKLIKWKMMIVKDADIKRRTAESKTIVEKRKGKEQKDMSKERAKSPKKGGKKTPELQQAKEGSKLKKRGEEDDEHKFIDDEPDDGAQHYFIVTGFHDPYLLQVLENINVRVSCVIAVTCQEYSGMNKSAVKEEKPEDIKNEELKRELNVFWRDLLSLLQHQPDTSSLHDVARLDYEVSTLIVPTDPQDHEQRVCYSSAIFEDIAGMLYNLLDAKRLYLTYLANLKLAHIPLFGEQTTDNAQLTQNLPNLATPGKMSKSAVDMRYYNDLMNTIPQESVSVALVMHCMLEQVVATEKGIDIPVELSTPVRADRLNSELSVYLAEIAAKLGLESQEHEMLSEVLDLPPDSQEKGNPPELININDEICIRTHHLKPHYGFDAEAVEKTMMQFLHIARLRHMRQPTLTESKQRAIRLQELLHFCASSGLSKPEIDHAFKQFVFESMDLTKCDRNGFPLQRTQEGLHQQPIPWDDPYPFYRVMIPALSQKSTREDLTLSASYVGERKDDKQEIMREKSHTDRSVKSLVRPKHYKFGESHRRSCSSTSEKAAVRKDLDVFESTQEIKRGILVSSSQSHSGSLFSPRHSVSTSVHFDVPSSQDGLDSSKDIVVHYKNTADSLVEVTDAQQRNLDNWCFAEHFKPHILLQVLQEAVYHLPFIETYHHKRDQSLMLVLHNPYNRERQNNLSWHTELHSNTGFRNYLENTAESIQVWLKKKEAEYRAELLSKEVASIQKEDSDKFKAVEKAEKKGKGSPRRSTAKSRSPVRSASSSLDRLSARSSNPYIRHGSIKAWQAEQVKLTAEEEEKEKVKLDKRSRSAQKLKEKQDKEKEKQGKGTVKSAQLKQDDVTPAPSVLSQVTDAKTETEPVNVQPYWPFTGYDTGNLLMHMLGATSTLFPSDGGTIKTEKTERVQGNISIRSAVQKDGHVLVVHIINPSEDLNLPENYATELEAMNTEKELAHGHSEREKLGDSTQNSVTHSADVINAISEQKIEDREQAELKTKARRYAVSQFGSITAHLSDGMVLALSQFGPTGESYLKPYEPPKYFQSTETETQSQTNIPNSPSRSKTNVAKTKGNRSAEVVKDKGAASEEYSPDETDVNKVKTDEHSKQDFQELLITCPDGLSVKYFLQSSVGVVPASTDDRQLVVRQSYQFKTKGIQQCESARNKYIQTEISRVITADGSVIKNMVDGSIEVLSADGTVSVFKGRSSSGLDSDISKKEKDADSIHKGKALFKNRKTSDASWVITYPGGDRIQIFKESGTIVELASLSLCTASDPETKQVMSTRDDHVIMVNYPSGESVVEHADGTRISTYYRDLTVLDEDIDEGEITSTKNSLETVKFVKVECPAFATVEFNTTTSENLTIFGNETSINVFPDGYYMLHHSQGGRLEIDTEGTLTYFPRRSRFLEHLMPERELQFVLRHNADIIVETVDPHGNIFNVRSNGESLVIPALGEDMFFSKIQLDCSDASFYDHQAPRYFIVHADGTGTELLRYKDVAEYLLMADQNPATAVLKEALPGHPGVTSITVLKPYLSGISEKWFKKYDEDSIVPQGLRCRDLKTLPPKEYKKPGPKFGTNVGKGLSIGSVIMAPVRIPILRCPEKLEIRQLLQYKPVTEQMRKKLQDALHEYANTVVARMQADNLMAIEDPRSENEKFLAQDLKTLAESQKLETREIEPNNVKMMYEQAVAPPPPLPPAKPAGKRKNADWERIRKEKQEEADAKRIIKNKIIAPYFESDLGKVFLLAEANGTAKTMWQPPQDRRKSLSAAKDGLNKSSSHTKSFSSFIQNIPYFAINEPTSTEAFKGPSGADSSRPKKETHLHMVSVGRDVIKRPHTPLISPKSRSNSGPSGADSSRPKKETHLHMALVGRDVIKRPHTPLISPRSRSNSDRQKKTTTPTKTTDLSDQSPEASSKKGQEFGKSMDQKANVNEQRKSGAPLNLPMALQGGKPGVHPNLKYSIVEDPVRRQVKTSSTAGVKSIKHKKKMRGLICYPELVDFGTLQEGITYSYTVMLTNTGIDACRFKVRQPPPTIGLRVRHAGGSVAAGMSVDLNLELYAIASGTYDTSEMGKLHCVLEIVGEADILELPITATILTADDYEKFSAALGPNRTTAAHVTTKNPNSLPRTPKNRSPVTT